MKTLQLTTEVIQSYHLLFTLLVVLAIEVVFIVDLFIYTRMLKKRNRLQIKLGLLEIGEIFYNFLEDKTVKEKLNISEEESAKNSEENAKIQSTISSIKSKIKDLEHKIENYKGLSKHVLGFIGVK
ncbi:MAG: hypothetical protein QXF12_00110 [Candidatus Aenigmatarchaeota archaeon]